MNSHEKRFAAALDDIARQLNRSGAASASYKFEDWADALRAGRLDVDGVVAGMRRRLGDPENAALLRRFVDLAAGIPTS